MSFISLKFGLFFVSLLFLYYVVPKRVQWYLLLAASMLFYVSFGWKGMLYVLLTVGTTYAVTRYIESTYCSEKKALEDESGKLTPEEKKQITADWNRKRKLAVAGQIILNLGILLVIKYGNFFLENVELLLKPILGSDSMPELPAFAPIGISFYTLTSIGYCIDIYRGNYKAERNIGKLALLVSYFPSIMQGPFNRFDTLSAEMFKEHKFDYTEVKFGLQRFVWGMFKKLVIADRLAIFVNGAYASWEEYSALVLVCATVCYAVQLYMDFSGYMDMTLGISEMLDIPLAENFRQPYFSKNVGEFWRRWHITLGEWFKDYIMFPFVMSGFGKKLGKKIKDRYGKKAGKVVPMYLGNFVVWFATGLWHGAQWNYIAWGLYYGVIMVISMICEPLFDMIVKKCRIRTEVFSYRLFQMVRTFLIVCFGDILFRAAGLLNAVEIIKKILFEFDFLDVFSGEFSSFGIVGKEAVVVLLSCILVFFVSVYQEAKGNLREKLAEQNLIFRWGCYYAILFVIIIFGCYGIGYDASAFIYQQF